MSDLLFMFVTLVIALAVLIGGMALLNWCAARSPLVIRRYYKGYAGWGLSLFAACASEFAMLSHL